ncbi:TonB-dependent receptor [soil metagenome]
MSTSNSARAKTLMAGAATALVLSFAGQALAQTEVAEIVVTSERRETKLQDTPVSVSAFSQETMAARGATNLQDLGNFTPNLELHQTNRPAGGGSAYASYIRGVGTGDFQFPTDPGVGVYVDDVYLARAVGGLMSLDDIERAEVLKGPQGTLFGRNTIGGAINIVTEKPDLGELSGVLKARVGNYGRTDVALAINGPIIAGKLAGKLSASFLNSDGWSTRLDHQNGNNEHRIVFRTALRYVPTDTLDVQFNADYSEQNNVGPQGYLIRYLTSPAPFPPAKAARFNTYAAAGENLRLGLPAGSLYDNRWATTDPYTNNALQGGYDDYQIGGASVVATWDVNDALTIKSVTAFRGVSAKIGVDGDQTPYSLQTSQTEMYDHQYSQELQFFGTAMDDRLKYLVGLYAFQENGSSKLYTESFHGIWENIPLALRTNSDAADTFTYFYMKAKSYAVFTQESFAITPQIELTLGGRYNWDEKDYAFAVNFTQRGVAQVPFSRDSQSWESFTPKAGINWRPADNILVYASYQEGFKSGGWGSSNSALSPTPRYEPETIATWEIGAKTGWFDRRLTANVAVFQSDYKDIQFTVQKVDPVTGANLRTTQNSGDADIQGFEAEFVAVPTDGLTLNMGVGYVDAKFSRLTPQALAILDPFNRPNAVKIGDPLPQVPDWSVSGGAQYVFHLGAGDLTVRGDASYKGDQFLTLGDPTSFQAAYTLYNAAITFAPNAVPGLELSLNGTNLSDEVYYAYHATLPPTGEEVALPVQPRLVYATAKFKF